VQPGAEKEINISGDVRNRVLQQVESVFSDQSVIAPAAVTSPFDPADKEIRRLIRDGRFIRSFTRFAIQNIGTAERRRRLKLSILGAVLSLALFFSILFLVDDELTSRLARISTMLPNIMFVTYMLSSQLGL